MVKCGVIETIVGRTEDSNNDDGEDDLAVGIFVGVNSGATDNLCAGTMGLEEDSSAPAGATVVE